MEDAQKQRDPKLANLDLDQRKANVATLNKQSKQGVFKYLT